MMWRVLCLIACLIYSALVNAERPHYWLWGESGQAGHIVKHKTPKAACDWGYRVMWADRKYIRDPSADRLDTAESAIKGRRYFCGKKNRNGGPSIVFGLVWKEWVACKLGEVWFPDEMVCKVPDPEKCRNLKVVTARFVGFSGGYNGCYYEECGAKTWTFDNSPIPILVAMYCPSGQQCGQGEAICTQTIDPIDNLPEGCADFGGKQVCRDKDDPENCYLVNGERVCAKQDSVCGFKNGVWKCVSKGEDNCGYFNGEYICFNKKTGEPIDPDSPDNPKNGGDGDGDDTNDPLDPRKPEEGGDPDNQPDSERGENLKENKELAKMIGDEVGDELEELGDKLIEEMPDGDQLQPAKEQFDEGMAEIEEQGQDFLDSVTSGDGGFTQQSELDQLTNKVLPIFKVTGCSPLKFDTPLGPFAIGCDSADKVRGYLAWIFPILTLYGILSLLLQPINK